MKKLRSEMVSGARASMARAFPWLPGVLLLAPMSAPGRLLIEDANECGLHKKQARQELLQACLNDPQGTLRPIAIRNLEATLGNCKAKEGPMLAGRSEAQIKALQSDGKSPQFFMLRHIRCLQALIAVKDTKDCPSISSNSGCD